MATVYYKDYAIDCGVTYEGIISVEYCGDDLVFDTVEDAKAFIDKISADEEDY